MLSGYYAAAAAAAASAQPPSAASLLPPRDRSPATSQSATSEADCERGSSSSRQRLITPSPPLNPGSPPRRGEEELPQADQDLERGEEERDDDDEELALEV